MIFCRQIQNDRSYFRYYKAQLDHKILGKEANKILQKKYNKYRFKLFKEGIRKQLNIQKDLGSE